MTDLLRADFRRVFKDKLLIVMGILAVVFALITPLLYALLFAGTDLQEDPMLAGLITGKQQFFASFSLGNNLGFIAPVLLAIVLCKDFSFGTVRNKIIAGKTRSRIFLSLFTVCSVTLIAAMLLHAFVTLGVSSLFFPYQTTPFETADVGYFLVSLAFSLLILLFVSALLSWLCAAMKNVGLVIVLYVAVTFGLVMIGSIVRMIAGVMEAMEDSSLTATIEILRFMDRINVANAVSYIGTGTAYTVEDILYLTVPSVLGIGGFVGLGLLQFNKRDLK